MRAISRALTVDPLLTIATRNVSGKGLGAGGACQRRLRLVTLGPPFTPTLFSCGRSAPGAGFGSGTLP